MSNNEPKISCVKDRLASLLSFVPYPLDRNIDVNRVAKKISKDLEARSLCGPSISVQILSSFTADYLIDHLVLMFARRGFDASIRFNEYGKIATAILDSEHELHKNPPDLFLIFPTYRDLLYCPTVGSDFDDSDAAVKKEVALWAKLWERLPAPAVQLSFSPPGYRPLADLDGFLPGGMAFHSRNVNLGLSRASTSSIALLDSEYLSHELGIINWDDPHTYNLCKQPFSMDALPHVADAVAAVAQGLLGKAQKVLVLDLDNTVWGGVIGDDGIDGIQLGPETSEGEAYTHFQHYVEKLRHRGVVLAVCSKNKHEVAEDAFCNHPAMVLKREHIASFVANFKDKPSNLKQISKELNLSLDSFVFVDDSPVERELMRMKLPEVLTVEMPENPAFYVQTLERCRVFPIANLTADDLNRSNSYKLRSTANLALETATDMESFLRELKATAVIERFDDSTKDRVVQLIAKTNQFKLNPNQFTPKELAAENRAVLCIRLKDRLQDYGIVAVAVLRIVKDRLRIENWVMSCRVFSRRLEYLTFDLIMEHACEHGVKDIDLTYIPSAKNSLVYDLIKVLDFKKTGAKNCFSNSVQKFKENVCLLPHHISVVR